MIIQIGQDELIKYPFLPDSGNYVKDKGFDLKQFGTDESYKLIIEKAFERILISVNGKIYKSDNLSLPIEVFSFLISIVLLKLCGSHTLIQRFALAESRRAEILIESDLKNIQNTDVLITKIYKDLFSINLSKYDKHFKISISDYITHAIFFNEKEWKLVNRRVECGNVYLSADKTARLVRHSLSKYIKNKILSSSKPQMYKLFELPVQKLMVISKQFNVQQHITSTEYPPCIKNAINVLEQGENLSHSGRFLLATFLLNRKQSISQIAPLFKNAPDYNPKTTLYQLNHLSGSSDKVKYICPSCEKTDQHNLCFRSVECKNIVNPLQFGKK